MLKTVIVAIILLALIIPVSGCEELDDLTQGVTTSTSQGLKIEKSVELGSDWQMKQLGFRVGADDKVEILLKLGDGDEADGFFYLERGETVDFRITGKSQLFRSTEGDRFSFSASQDEGDTYTLLFRNTADEDEGAITVFLEVIYPLGGEIYVPVED